MVFWWFIKWGVCCKYWESPLVGILGAYSESKIGSSRGMSDGRADRVNSDGITRCW